MAIYLQNIPKLKSIQKEENEEKTKKKNIFSEISSVSVK